MKHIRVFAFKTLNDDHIPPGAPVLDCRILPNPWRKEETDAQIMGRCEAFVNLPAYRELMNAGFTLLKYVDTIWVGCQHGRHRSTFIANRIAAVCQDPVTVHYPHGEVQVFAE